MRSEVTECSLARKSLNGLRLQHIAVNDEA